MDEWIYAREVHDGRAYVREEDYRQDVLRLRTALERIMRHFNPTYSAHEHEAVEIARAALAGSAAPPASEGRLACRSCGAFVDSRGKCRIPEHNA